MLRGEGPDSLLASRTPCAGQAAQIRRLGLPISLAVRFVRVRLAAGEDEVRVTSWLDKSWYPTASFLELYGLRGGIETFHGLLKTRLDLESFSGTGAEAVRQDFHATVYLSRLESILTASAQDLLDTKETRHPQAVNRAISFNAIKNQALDLLLGDRETGPLLERLTESFLTNPTLAREGRNPPRKNTGARKPLDFHKRQRKHCS